MLLISSDLNIKTLTHTIFLGLQVIIDEWYWLLSDTLFQFSMKKLHVKLLQVNEEDEKLEIKRQIELRNNAHDKFREMQILLRSHDLT